MQHAGSSCGRNPHLAFYYRDPRAFDTAVDCEHRSRHRDPAIRRSHIEMSFLTLRCLYDDVAAAQLNRGIAAAHGNAKFSTLVHLHNRAVAEPQHGSRIRSGADPVTLGKFVTGFEGLLPAEAHTVKDATERFHTRPHAGRAREELVLNQVSADTNDEHRRRCHHPAETVVGHTRQGMLPGFNRCYGAFRFLILMPAIDTLMKMGLYQHGARRRQLAQTILRQQELDVVAPADRVHG